MMPFAYHAIEKKEESGQRMAGTCQKDRRVSLKCVAMAKSGEN